MIFGGVLAPIEEPLTSFLEWIHTTTGATWAWSIILLTVCVRIALVPLTVKQQQSMRAMQALQPELQKLKQKHKNDRQALNQEMMQVYRENKVNPMGSCLPLLVQIPIFIALYFVLRDLHEETAAGDDLSFLGGFIPDITQYLHQLPGATLATLMLVYIGSQVGSTLLMPASMDKMQRYLFLALPIIFSFVLIQQDFPAGLMLYWITTNLWTVGQAAVIRYFFPPPLVTHIDGTRTREPEGKRAKERSEKAAAKAAATAGGPSDGGTAATPRGAKAGAANGAGRPPKGAAQRRRASRAQPPPGGDANGAGQNGGRRPGRTTRGDRGTG